MSRPFQDGKQCCCTSNHIHARSSPTNSLRCHPNSKKTQLKCHARLSLPPPLRSFWLYVLLCTSKGFGVILLTLKSVSSGRILHACCFSMIVTSSSLSHLLLLFSSNHLFFLFWLSHASSPPLSTFMPSTIFPSSINI